MASTNRTMDREGRTATRADERADERAGAVARRRPALRLLAWTFAIACVIGGAVFLAGFIAFTASMESREPTRMRNADAIVVLTGGASRISDGVALLAEGRGRRLLITGVNPVTSPEEIRRTLKESTELIDCCVDLGHRALNTRGNALEIADWTRTRNFRSIVVVTSAWHMPRAQFELGRVLPEVELIPYPVVTDRMQTDRWWTDPRTLVLLLKEYLKYIMARAKIRPAQAVSDGARASEMKPPHGRGDAGAAEKGLPSAALAGK